MYHDRIADPLTGECARCGKLYDEHPGGFCPDALDASGMVAFDAPQFEPKDDDGR
jgi:hypothetical protein